jgi:hypothetical protein
MDSAIADMQHAAERMEPVGLDQRQTEVIVEAAKTAAKIIMSKYRHRQKVADVLEKKKRIEGHEIREILRQAKESA